ncbi:MAG: hypothetical protein Q9219_006549 [cf. Caloplaca sp. 3 TL-2023]
MASLKRAANSPQTIPQNISGVPLDLSQTVTICHPGYHEAADILISFAAFDGKHGGICHNTALIACGIIAGNFWDGCFTKDAIGEEVVTSSSCDGVLPPGTYYFQLPTFSVDQPYPIVPIFRHWRFPHQNLPPSWAGYSRVHTPFRVLQPSVRDDGKCRMSYCKEGCDKAHMCPVEEDQWFDQQSMEQYIKGKGKATDLAIDDTNNRFHLRADLHRSFRDKKFVFVPKDGNFVVHVLEPSVELTTVYHNSELHPLDFVPIEYLFARFAWALFPFVGNFLRAGKDRWLLPVGSAEPYLETADNCRIIGSGEAFPNNDSSATRRARTEPMEGVTEVEEAHWPSEGWSVSKKRVKTSHTHNQQGPSAVEDTENGMASNDEPQPMDYFPRSPPSLPPGAPFPLTADVAFSGPAGCAVPSSAQDASDRASYVSRVSQIILLREIDENIRLARIEVEALAQDRGQAFKEFGHKVMDGVEEYLKKTAAELAEEE